MGAHIRKNSQQKLDALLLHQNAKVRPYDLILVLNGQVVVVQNLEHQINVQGGPPGVAGNQPEGFEVCDKSFLGVPHQTRI